MAHVVRILSDATLKRALLVDGADIAAIDENTKKAINGDEGGTWSSAAAVEIAGTGVVIGGPWTMDGAAVTVTTAANKPILFARGTRDDYFGIDPAHAGASPTVFVAFMQYYGLQPYQASWFGGLIFAAPGNRIYTPLPVYNGAPQVDSVVVDFRVRAAHANVPQYLPRMRVFAVTTDGTVIPLRSPDATTDADGFQFFSPTPATGAAWYALGAFQQWTYTCNVVLPCDSGLYRFFIEIIDESGSGAWVLPAGSNGNQFRSATAYFSNVTIFDGRD